MHTPTSMDRQTKYQLSVLELSYDFSVKKKTVFCARLLFNFYIQMHEMQMYTALLHAYFLCDISYAFLSSQFIEMCIHAHTNCISQLEYKCHGLFILEIFHFKDFERTYVKSIRAISMSRKHHLCNIAMNIHAIENYCPDETEMIKVILDEAWSAMHSYRNFRFAQQTSSKTYRSSAPNVLHLEKFKDADKLIQQSIASGILVMRFHRA